MKKQEMWDNLPETQKNKYKKLITNFASLTEAFTQKSFGDKHVKPFINSKYQETAFQYAFKAVEEDIANTSFDASLLTKSGNKYLVGIKSFLYSSGDQKIAQFKSVSTKWTKLFDEIRKNAKKIKADHGTKRQLDKLNYDIYLELATNISRLRNERIRSSKAQLRGFDNDDTVVSVYHVLMPSSTKDHKPLIHVGETSYTEINLDKLKVLGCTSLKTPNNFRFTDGVHVYKYASADSQLFMTFDNKNIVVDTWDVKYVSDAMKFFEELNESEGQEEFISIPKSEYHVDVPSFSWMLTDKNGQVNTRSGINEFNAQSKYSKNERKEKIKEFLSKYKDKLTEEELENLRNDLFTVLLPMKKSNKEIILGNETKEKIKLFAKEHAFLENDLIDLIYSRPHNEVYIPIPDSKQFHKDHPNFFGDHLGINLMDKKGKIIKEQKDRTFMMRFLPSGNEIEGYINQERGKAIQSPHSQSTLGKWLRSNVFQLKDLELLDAEKLDILGINAIRMVKNKVKKTIDVQFIWIDPENPPEDAIGWVKQNIKKSSDEV
ncbi:hypothetical protein [Lactobacillus hominis]|uniref:hypothetical protein n=1 Tax=Lactobacillus hominis TaxID=1203033 RepID=UPI0023F39F40|nr:hypothetical protein [Lactobacillus hominis]